MSEKCTDNPRDCPLVPRVEALEEANKQHGSTHREVFDRLRKLESKTAVQDTLLTTMDDKLEDIKTDQKSILQKVETLEAKPGKRWDGLVDKLLFTAAGAALMWIAAGMPGVGS